MLDLSARNTNKGEEIVTKPLVYTKTTVATYEVPAGRHIAVVGADFYVQEWSGCTTEGQWPDLPFDSAEEAQAFFNLHF